MRSSRAKVGHEVDERVLTDVGKCALWSVEETRHTQFLGSEFREVISCGEGIFELAGFDGDERNHVDYSDARMHSLVRRDVELRHRSAREDAWRFDSGEGEDAAIVIGITM